MLNKQQQEVVDTLEGPLLCLAGAGTGKTHTVVHRIAHILLEGTEPENILLLTFTNKAAKEMLTRVNEVVGSNVASRIQGSTYHSFCVKIIRKYSNKLGINRNFSIMSDSNVTTLITSILGSKKDNIDSKKITPKSIAGIISKHKNTKYTIKECLELAYGSYVLADSNTIKVISETYKEYEAYKKERNLLDFDDLLILMNKLLSDHPDVCKTLSDRYKYILVDEYQDSNHMQLTMLKLLRSYDNKNICVVGDDAQCIYGFRGADFDNILNFEKDFPGAKVIKLTENYRSSDEIVRASNQIVLNAGEGYKKELTSARGPSGVPVQVIPVATQQQEAIAVVEDIKDKIERLGASPADFGVITRVGRDLDMVESALKDANIPYEKYGGISIFQREHVVNFMSLVDYLANPLDSISLIRLLQLIPGIGEKFALNISMEIFENGEEEVVEKYKKRKFGKSLKEFLNNTKDMREKYNKTFNEDSPKEMLEYITNLKEKSLKSSNADKSAIAEAEKKLKDEIKIIKNLLSTTVAKSLNQFEADFSLSRTEKEPPEGGAVVISTVHSVKGLEFKYVYVLCAVENKFPITPRYEGESALIYDAIHKDLEEERRIFYVAVSRARDLLVVLCPRKQGFYYQPAEISRYINDLMS